MYQLLRFFSAGHGPRRSTFSQILGTPMSIPEKPMLVVKSWKPEEEQCDCLTCSPRNMEQLLGHVLAYGDMLYNWKLFYQRTQLLKSLHVELRLSPLHANVMDESKMERLHYDCSNVLEAPGLSRKMSHASSSKLPSCSVCHLPVKGLSRPCLTCSHVTHLKCWQNQQFRHCPTGCGCRCRDDLNPS